MGFHGGYASYLHNIGVISIPYKSCIGYDLIASFLKRYQTLSDKLSGCRLDYVFYLINHDELDDLTDETEIMDDISACFVCFITVLFDLVMPTIGSPFSLLLLRLILKLSTHTTLQLLCKDLQFCISSA